MQIYTSQLSNTSDNNKEQEKEFLSTFIHQTIDADNLIVLAGSGTSLTFNENEQQHIAPSMRDLWEECQGISNFNDIKNFSGYRCFVSTPEEKNIELLLSICDSLLAMKTVSDTQRKELEVFLQSAKNKILEKTSFVDKTIGEQWKYHNQFIRILGHRNQKQQRLKIFTTNYDLAFEVAASNTGMIVIDGFEFSNPAYFNPAWFHYDIVSRGQFSGCSTGYLSNVIQLYKLHGSVDWVKNTKSNLVYRGDPTRLKNDEEAVFIYPSNSKYQSSYDSPYLDMMSAFLNTLQQPKTALICLGFGFNDKHLNNAIMMALRTNPEILLLVVTKGLLEEGSGFNPDIRGNLMNLVKSGDSRIMLVDGLFSEFVDELPNRVKESPEEILARTLAQVITTK